MLSRKAPVRGHGPGSAPSLLSQPPTVLRPPSGVVAGLGGVCEGPSPGWAKEQSRPWG